MGRLAGKVKVRPELAPDQSQYDPADTRLRSAAQLLQDALSAPTVEREEELWCGSVVGSARTACNGKRSQRDATCCCIGRSCASAWCGSALRAEAMVGGSAIVRSMQRWQQIDKHKLALLRFMTHCSMRCAALSLLTSNVWYEIARAGLRSSTSTAA